MSIKPNDPTLNAELRRDEGVSYVPYFDTLGIKTTGVGHNMIAKPLPATWFFPLSNEQVDQLLTADIAEVFAGLDKNIPWWTRQTPGRQRMLANMAFMGVARLMGFKRMLAAMQEGDFVRAGVEQLDSKWAEQVKGRAGRMHDLMLGKVL